MVRRPPPLLTLLLVMLLMACGASDVQPPGDTAPPDVPDASPGSSLAFDPNDTITLTPGEARDVHVVVEPPDTHVVRFALLGESLDASLDTDEKVTGADGRTSVSLTAPGSATTFRLRASAGENVTAEVPVSVSGEGFATIRVTPSYKGIRSTPMWTASAVARSTCGELPGMPAQDGPIVGVGIGGAAAVLKGLPVGPIIAVTLRSARAVAGCANISDLKSGEVRDVTIKVRDVPVDIAATDLGLVMTMTPDGSVVWPLFEALSERFADRFLPEDQSEAKRLLDAMQASVGDVAAFAEARVMGGWDAVLAARLDDGGQRLHDRIKAWINLGFEPVLRGETITGRLSATSSGVGHGIVTIDEFYGLPVDAAGVPAEHLVSLSFEPGDSMIVGGTVTWVPSLFVAAAGDQGAGKAYGIEPSAVTALVRVVGCDQLASLFETVTPLPPSCGTECIEAACTDGLTALWRDAKTESIASFETVRLTYTVSGTASVNGDAIPVALDASWVGTQKYKGQEAALKGEAIAGDPAPQTR